MANEFDSVRSALARAVAEYKISDEAIEMAAKQLTTLQYPIRGIDVCTYGICLDFFFEGKDWWQVLPGLVAVEGAYLKEIEIFPWGIPWPDLFHVRVTQNLEGMPQVSG